MKASFVFPIPAAKRRGALAALLIACLLLSCLLCGCGAEPAPSGSAAPAGSSGTGRQTEPSAPDSTPAQTEPPATGAPPVATTAPAPEDESWKLLLVNADHPLPEDYSVTLKALRNNQFVDERIYPELQKMFDDARAVGIYPLINESFRTGERQQQIMDKYIASYEASGLSHDAAVKKAREIVALPGTSEHQLGLALDIIAEYDADSTATWNWLRDNCWRYGFILRYPADKVEITGISYEPWHFRYVGVPTAQEITEQGLALEEYVERLG